MVLTQLKALIAQTDGQYPDWLHLGHNLFCLAEWRKWRGDDCSWPHKVVASVLCIANGGSFTLDLLHGKTSGLFTGEKTATYWLGCCLLMLSGKNNPLYRAVATPRSPLRLLCRYAEMIDYLATAYDRIDTLALAKHPNAPIYPYIITFVLKRAGAMFRWLEARGRGIELKYPLAVVDGAFWEVLLFTGLIVRSLRATRGNAAARANSRFWIIMLGLLTESLHEVWGIDVFDRFNKVVRRAIEQPGAAAPTPAVKPSSERVGSI